MSSLQYYTAQGLERLKTELKELKSKGRSDAARQISEARDKGDLSENAEYDAAKEAQAHLELRIAKLAALVAKARVLDPKQIDLSCVRVLSRVRMRHMGIKQELSYQLVSEEEANLEEGKISLNSPIGQALMGKKVGERVKIEAPAGAFHVEVLEISL